MAGAALAARRRAAVRNTFVGRKPYLAAWGKDVPAEIAPVRAKLVSAAYKLK
ncbi:hypothetical protein [Hymenobacter bucti]|uniref:Uncharacterized protein n=1 Tax=Hymenobacter bucti TaxID=1844114 RepID=A0ABW4QYH2_9BACT